MFLGASTRGTCNLHCFYAKGRLWGSFNPFLQQTHSESVACSSKATAMPRRPLSTPLIAKNENMNLTSTANDRVNLHSQQTLKPKHSLRPQTHLLLVLREKDF